MGYLDSIIWKYVVLPAMNYFGIDDVVAGAVNYSAVLCWPIFFNNSIYGSVLGVNGLV